MNNQFFKIIFTTSILLMISLRPLCAQNGIVKSYYADGTLRSEISYVNEILDGSAYWYYPNGNLEREKNYSRGKLLGYVREYYESGLIKEEYTVKDGIKDGSHRIYYDNGALKELIIFAEGIQVNKSTFEYDPTFVPSPDAYQAGNRQQEIIRKKKTEIICDVDICPVPIGGMRSIQENLIYPEHALLYGLEGIVTLIVTIDEYGKVIETQVIKNLGLGCDEAAQEAVKKTIFIPGQSEGKAVQARITLNVDFKIFDKALAKLEGIQNKTIDIQGNISTSVQNEIINKQEQKSKVRSETVAITQEREMEIAQYDSNKSELTKLNTQQESLTNYKVVRQLTEIRCDLELDECPYPVNGIKSINKNLEIPKIAKRFKLKGEIVVEVTIDKFGLVRDIKIINGIGYGCDEAVESALLKTKFKPAKNKGEEVEVKAKVYFPFNYED